MGLSCSPFFEESLAFNKHCFVCGDKLQNTVPVFLFLRPQIKFSSPLSHVMGVKSCVSNEWPDILSLTKKNRKHNSIFWVLSIERRQFSFLLFSWRLLGTLTWHSVYHIHDREGSNGQSELRGMVSGEALHISRHENGPFLNLHFLLFIQK